MTRNVALLACTVAVASACGGAVSAGGGASYPQVPYEEAQRGSDDGAPGDFAATMTVDSAPAPVPTAARAPTATPRKHGTKAMGGLSQAAMTGQRQDYASGPRGGPLLNEPMVVYLGWLRLRVKRVIEAVDAITALAQSRGGYVQSMTPQAIVVRVPGADFDAAMLAFAGVGEVVDRRVKALDVTKQYTDLEARLQVAVDARDRLLALLKTVQNVEERLQILEEVKRLSEHIETAESTLATLRNLANLYTITIELEPVVANYGAAAVHRSPFPWIRGLSPHAVTLEEGKDDVQLAAPKGFVLFEKDHVWRAQAADTSMVRVGRVKNEPHGDAAFWVDAVQFELDGRDEEKVDDGSAGAVRYRVWRNKELKPRYWLVGTLVVGDRLYVVEAFLPNEAAWQAHRDGIKTALASLQGK
ncbi:MAG: DUF4349 domain-containing protein [Myxococcales bacterium]|nr:DUF4349 domain-containing protein [Myxococcales bacterium]